MGRHVAGDMPALDRLVDDACAEIGREIDALCVPRLAGVVLGGGYGRGEGGAWLSNAECRLSNDLDFFAITEPGVSESGTVAEISAELEPVSKKWTAELGVDVDFAVKTPWRLKHDEERLMVQELLRGHCDVFGRKSDELFAGIRRIDAAELPWRPADLDALSRRRSRPASAHGTASPSDRCRHSCGKAGLPDFRQTTSRISSSTRHTTRSLTAISAFWITSQMPECWA